MTAGGARGFVALTRACAAWPAAAVWVALALAPAFAVPQAYRLFEENKVLLTRILVVPAFAVALALRARWKPLGIAGIGLATWLVASLVAAFASTSPALALPGDYLRQDGWLTDVALAGAFLGAFACGRDRGLRGLTLDLILAAGVVSALVAVLGYTPWRPFFVDVEGTRASGLAGGPTYFGTAMAALVPLALAQRERRGFGAFALVAFLGVLASGSRLALLAASLGAAYVLVHEPRERRARPLLVGGLLVLAIGALSLSPWKSALPPDLLPTRLADLTRPSELGTRVDLYAEAITAIAATPARLAFGHGPDTIGVEFTRGISEALQTAIGATTRVDRFHSELLDVVFTRGVFAALGLIVLVVGAWRTRRSSPDDSPDRAVRGLALVLTLLALASVAGVTAKLTWFVALGLLAQRERTVEAPLARWIAPALVGAVVAAAMVATHSSNVAIALVPLAWIVPRRDVVALLAYVAPSALVAAMWAIAGPGIDPSLISFYGDQGADMAILAIGLVLASAVALTAAIAFSTRTFEPAPTRARSIAAVVALLAAAFVARDDGLRIVADIRAGVAGVAQARAGKPELAARLLERAIELAPEIAQYRIARALALVDVAVGADAEERLALVPLVGEEIGRARQVHAADGHARAASALCVLRLASLIPAQRDALLTLADGLVDEALARAPQAAPVLEIAAQARLARQRTADAAELADHALRLDASRPGAHLARARAAAQARELEAAAVHYAQALVLGGGVVEARAALAYAAMAREQPRDAGALIAAIVLAVDQGATLDVEGARPLLHFVAWHHFSEAFAEATRLLPDRRETIREVQAAMTY